MEIEGFDCSVGALGYLRVPRARDFVDAICAMHHPGAFRSEHQERSRQEIREVRAGNAHQLTSGSRRISQWSEKIESCANAKRSPRLAGMTHGGVKGGREQEADSS